MTSPIPPTWDVPESLRRRVGASVGRQRAIVAEGHVLLLLHALPRPDDPTRREGRVFWRRPDGSWRASSREGDSTATPLRAHVDGFYAAAEAFEERVEQAVSADDWFGVLHELAPFARTARNLARALQEAREAVGPDPDLIAARDRATDAERGAELVHLWASQGLDHSIARSNEEQAALSTYISRASHRLNLLAALTLPLTALGSFLGTNLVSGLETWGAPYTFWAFGAVSFALGIAVRASMPDPPEIARFAPKSKPKKKPHRG